MNIRDRWRVAKGIIERGEYLEEPKQKLINMGVDVDDLINKKRALTKSNGDAYAYLETYDIDGEEIMRFIKVGKKQK